MRYSIYEIKDKVRQFGGFPIADRLFGGNNFMTPTIVGCYKVGKHRVEISMGEFMQNTLIGVTVKDHDELNGCCHNFAELHDKFEELVQWQSASTAGTK